MFVAGVRRYFPKFVLKLWPFTDYEAAVVFHHMFCFFDKFLDAEKRPRHRDIKLGIFYILYAFFKHCDITQVNYLFYVPEKGAFLT